MPAPLAVEADERLQRWDLQRKLSEARRTLPSLGTIVMRAHELGVPIVECSDVVQDVVNCCVNGIEALVRAEEKGN